MCVLVIVPGCSGDDDDAWEYMRGIAWGGLCVQLVYSPLEYALLSTVHDHRKAVPLLIFAGEGVKQLEKTLHMLARVGGGEGRWW